MARPTKRTKAIDDEICEKISIGIPLAEICRQEHMPNRATIYDWINADQNFLQRIARARELGYDAIAEETLQIADDATNDWMSRKNFKGEEETVLNTEHVQRSKLRIETRLKLLSKWFPKKYGDKLDVTSAGNELKQTVVINTTPDIAKNIEGL